MNAYDLEDISHMLDDDEITSYEEGFMLGFLAEV